MNQTLVLVLIVRDLFLRPICGKVGTQDSIALSVPYYYLIDIVSIGLFIQLQGAIFLGNNLRFVVRSDNICVFHPSI